MSDNSCKAPDRHEPKLVCGYPLPCPHHTVFVIVGETSHPATGADSNGRTAKQRLRARNRKRAAKKKS